MPPDPPRSSRLWRLLTEPSLCKPGSAPAEYVDAPIYKIRKWKIKWGLLLSEITQTVQKLTFRLDLRAVSAKRTRGRTQESL